MPEPLKRLDNQTGHLTKAQRAARESAEAGLTRAKRISLRAPAWLTDEARTIFDTTRRRLRGLELLDNIDTDLLALYADALTRYQAAVKSLATDDPRAVQSAQAWSRLALQYAERLGISPTARARLAKRKAQELPPDPLEELLNEFSSYANSGPGSRSDRLQS